jgi:hypothetical protein
MDHTSKKLMRLHYRGHLVSAVPVYFENHTIHCGQSAELLIVNAGDTCVYLLDGL